ncbi:uncharacterized protein G6M90_00g088910 [Metarhizium brunneum]|uniref:Uncharacterized protein n=1 Tax=Metarhizium brunneum TaxID=500148 RepID=A0A7D5V1G9_9HYPO|nr:hypothetical protein G6M90_00g088910 [Metarhizium brunneum]
MANSGVEDFSKVASWRQCAPHHARHHVDEKRSSSNLVLEHYRYQPPFAVLSGDNSDRDDEKGKLAPQDAVIFAGFGDGRGWKMSLNAEN